MKKIVIGATAVILIAYLGFVLVGQVFPYVKWIAQSGNELVLRFDSAAELQASDEVQPAAKAWVGLPEIGSAPTSFEYRHDGFTTPRIEVGYDQGSNRYMTYRIGGNYDLPTHTKLKDVELGAGIEGELLVGRDNTVIMKWRDPGGPPYRYLYFFDPSTTEPEIVRLASVFAGAAIE